MGELYDTGPGLGCTALRRQCMLLPSGTWRLRSHRRAAATAAGFATGLQALLLLDVARSLPLPAAGQQQLVEPRLLLAPAD